jgi:hypothetical protein
LIFQREANGNPSADPLAMLYDKIRSPRDEKGTDVFDRYRSKEWSIAMFVMLARFARSFGLFQEQEYPVDGASTLAKLDAAWIHAHNRQGRPVVAIEHENDSGTDIVTGEISNLVASKAPLRVLITYPYGSTDSRTGTRGIQRRIAAALSGLQDSPAEFLVAIGGEEDEGQLRMKNPGDWAAYLWKVSDGSFERLDMS